MELIRTRRKQKLPNDFSYPIGAEALSTALQGVPQYVDLSLIFSWRDTFWASNYREKLKALGQIDIVEIRYWPAIGSAAAGWVISVHAIPVDHARDARQALSSHALPALKAALVAAPEINGYFFWKTSYDLSTRMVRVGA